MAVLLVERSDGVVTATMNRTERRNALDADLFEALRALFVEVGERADDRALVLTGAGGAFSSGGDLTPAAPSGDDARTVLRRFGRTAQALFDCPKPVIAAVDGVAAGAGMSLALGCDLIVASDRARFALLFVRRGLALDCGASWLAPRRVGPGRAAELALLGDWVDAVEAERIGLVNRVVPADDLAAAAHEWAARLAEHAPIAIGLIKRSMRASLTETFDEALEREADDQMSCTSDPDFRSRISAR